MLGSSATLISCTSEPLQVPTEKRIHVLLQCSRPLLASLHLLQENVSQYGVHIGRRM